MDVLLFAGFVIITIVLVVAIRKYAPDMALTVSICAGVIMMVYIVTKATPVVDRLQTLLGSIGMSGEYGGVIFKALGICFLTQFAADACKDAGESALSSRVEFGGKIALLVVALPLFEDILSITGSLIGG